ncbi:O-antigen/lipopolysaccharide transport integral membrane protein ABC transporter rfbD [Mycobacterium tuberculosis 02_1987]|nr:O-antigen/lipopolysaccharide transport integral membrane protein ABC transporter rfbD [Mycobacterium tuberculosis 02_1987]
MTFMDAQASFQTQSRTLARVRGDLVDGFRRHELWLHLGWQDIKQRYRRSVLGPFWITIATGTTAVAMGGLYSKLFRLELSEHLPYVTLGLIVWNLINAAILDGAEVFVANEGLIKQLPASCPGCRWVGVAADDLLRPQHRHLLRHRDHLS